MGASEKCRQESLLVGISRLDGSGIPWPRLADTGNNRGADTRYGGDIRMTSDSIVAIIMLGAASTPFPVNVLNWPPPDPLGWATFWVALASFVAAFVAAWEAVVTLRRLGQRALLKANFPTVEHGSESLFYIGCNVYNIGNLGVRDFRITFAFSPPARVKRDFTQTNHKSAFGENDVDGRQWATAGFIAGPIY